MPITPNAAPDSAPPSPRTKICRKPQRAHYDRASVEAIVDEALVCFVAFNHGGSVHCLPMACWRFDEHLYLHAAGNARMSKALLLGECAVSIAHLDGLVLARSAFHHSMNFRSVAIYGRFEEVLDPALELFLRSLEVHRYHGNQQGRHGGDHDCPDHSLATPALAHEEKSHSESAQITADSIISA